MQFTRTARLFPPVDGRAKRGTLFRGKKTAGFTLLEVGLAGTVLIFGLCSAIISLQRGFQLTDTSRTSVLAAQIMQSEIERLRLMSWADLTNPTLIPESEPINLALVYPDSPEVAKQFTALRTITPCPGRETSMVEIAVTVTWSSIDGVNHARTFRTRYSKNGLYDYYYTKHS